MARGLARRAHQAPTRIGVDETSFQKRHEYVTVVTDQDSGTVVHVADDRKQETMEAFLGTYSPQEREAIESVAMDMWGPYIAAVKATVPEAEEKSASTSTTWPATWGRRWTRCDARSTASCWRRGTRR